jgi:hypothetical protein
VKESEGRSRGQLIETLARRIDSWNLALPAIAVLEVIKPISYIAGQGLLLCEPVLSYFYSEPQVDDYASLLADRSNLDDLIARLEGSPPASRKGSEEES